MFRLSPTSISLRIAAATLIVAIAITVTLTAFFIQDEQRIFRADLEDRAESVTNIFAIEADNLLNELDVAGLNNLSEGVDVSQTIVRFYGSDGRLLSSNAPGEQDVVTFSPDPQGLAYLSLENRQVTELEDSLRVAQAIRLGDQVVGAIALDLSTSQIAENNARAIRIATGVSLFSVLFAIAATLVLTRAITNPIRNLVQEAQIIADGNFNYRIAEPKNEFDILVAALNNLAGQVSQSLESLETRGRYMEATIEVGSLSRRINNQDELLSAVTSFIQSRFDLYYTQIYLLDETKRFAILRAGTGEAGQALLARQHQLDTEGRSLIATAVQTRDVVLVEDTENSAIHKPNPLLSYTRSELTVPLIVGNEVLGVLDMQDGTPQRFNQDNVGVFTAMASQVASALYGTRAYGEIERAIERAERLNERITSDNWRNYLGSMSDEGRVQVKFDAYGETSFKMLDEQTSFHDIAEHMEDQNSLKQAITLGKQSIGEIVVRESESRQWTEEERELIQDAAKRLAQAAEQFRAFDETEAARQRAALLYNVTQHLAEAETIQDVVDAITRERVLQSVANTSIYLFELDENNNPDWMRLVSDSGGGILPMGTRFHIEDFALARLFVEDMRSPIFVGNTGNDPRLDNNTREVMAQQDTKAVVILPLTQGQTPLGIVTFDWHQPQTFTQERESTFRSLMTPIATAVSNLQLFEQTQRRAVEMETVAQVSTTAASNLNLEELIEAVCNLTKERFGLYHVHVYLLDEENENLYLAGGAGQVGKIMTAQKHNIALSQPVSLVAATARTKSGIVIDDVTESAEFMPNPMLPRTRSEMAVPMIVGQEVVGVLDAQSTEAGRFEKSEVQVFTTLAGQVAVAIENARAFEREQQTVERLREVDQLKSQFLANMSHELRTPLNAIIGYAGIMIDGGDGELPEDAMMDIEIIETSGKHLLSIINDILDLAKIEAKEMKLKNAPLDVPKIVSEVINSGRILAEEKGLELLMVGEDEVGKVLGDPVRLRQIIWNLTSNALKFTEKGGVTIRYGMHNKNEMYVRVEDTGMGIPEAQLAHVFERFKQVDESTTRQAGGTGLGLTITRELIQLHGGDIHLESELGVGSTFWFTLPIMQPEAETVTHNT